MAKMILSKQGLQKQRENMRLYERVLPSLELKRMQLMAELKRAELRLAAFRKDAEQFGQTASEQLPMLADSEMDLSGLVEIASVHIGEENVVGVRLPVLGDVKFHVASYSPLARPHWTDLLTEKIKEMVSRRITVQVAVRRVFILERAVRKITQRTNLFEKILIPEAKGNIRKIRIYLADADRAAVIRSKITKGIRRKQAMALRGSPK